MKNKVIETSIESIGYKKFEKAYQYALDMTKREIEQAVEGIYHNLNTLQSRSGNQLPFSSINYGTCTLPEGRMVIKALLDKSIEGTGKFGRTSIFPCGIFQYSKEINGLPGTPNYDLYKLALKSTAQRLYPNYCNIDWSGNMGYDKTDPRTYMSTMGALAGHEHLYVKINDGDIVDMTIEDLFMYCKYNIDIKGRPGQIWYNKKPLNESTPGKQIQSKSNLPNQPGVYSITYLPEDVTYIGSSSSISRRLAEHKHNIIKTGGLDAGTSFGDCNIKNYKFEVLSLTENYKEEERKYIETQPNINFKGIDNKYYKLVTQTERIYERPNFKQDLSIKQQLINLDESNIKVLDRDNKWVKVKHIFRNDKKNTPLMMHIYYNEYGKEYCLSCTEDHPLWNGEKFVRADQYKIGDKVYRADNKAFEVIDICWHWEPVDSFDIGTETGSFIGSDIIMHNCRTVNGFDINGFGYLKDGRGNICPVTIIMPTLAMQVSGEVGLKNVDEFIKLLDKKIGEAKDMLIERFNHICSQPPEAAKFMWENGTMEGYIPEEGIRSALKHGTLVIGQLGLAETLQILIGCDHTKHNGMELAKRIEELFNKRCKEFKEEYKLNFGVYYTPAENLCYTAMSKFKRMYGELPNISDKKYFTNSIHVPVWREMNPFEKIDIESELTGYSNAGCITYVELPSSTINNLEALESIVNYAMDKDIPYLGINLPNDHCEDCGYTNEFNDKCPKCGSKNIQQLRRVCGYLTGDYKTAFNKGKQQEVEHRVKHVKG